MAKANGEYQVWLAEMDQQLLRLRAAGVSWEKIGQKLGVPRSCAFFRGQMLSLPTKPVARRAPSSPTPLEPVLLRVDRPPLPAGHSIAWNAINRGGDVYPFPVYT